MPASPPPDDRELQNWPDYWRRYAELLFPAWLRVADPAAPTIRFVPEQRHWTWGSSYHTFSATLLDESLRWEDESIRWEEEWPGESSIDQSIAEFLAFGAPDDMAASFVASDLREVIRAREPARWRGLLAEAEALRWKALKQSSGAATQDEAIAPQLDYKRVGPAAWEWGDPADGYTAILSGDAISWNWHGPKDLGNTIGQSVVDFVAFGPDEKNAPTALACEMFIAIRDRDPQHWPKLLAIAKILQNRQPRQGKREDTQSGQFGNRKSRKSTAWEWGDSYNRYSAWLTDRGIYWSWEGEKDQGGSSEQTFSDFLSRGPLDTDAPAGIVREIHEAVLTRGGDAGPPPGQRQSHFETSEPRERPNQAPDDESPQPLGLLLLQGLAVIGVSVAISLAIAIVMPTLGKYVSILLPVLLGFAAAFRWGSLALIVAGFFGVAAGFGSQYPFERYSELARGITVTLTSISEAPRHPEATGFIVADARAARDFAGSMERTTSRQYGAGPREERWSLQVMPLVPSAWNRSQPVPAWIACTATPGFGCLRRSEEDVSRTIRVRDYEVDFYRAAIANAERRHGLASAPNAPVLEPSRDPIGAPGFYLAGAVLVPLAVYGLWAIALIGWRIFRIRRSRIKNTPAAQ